jgi:hypothetical protein
MVPDGVDPGWAYNPGASRTAQVTEQLVTKAAEAPADMGLRAMESLSAAEKSAFDAEHAQWVDDLMSAQSGALRSQQRIVGGLAVDDMLALQRRGVEVKSAAIWLRPGLVRGTKATRKQAGEKDLSLADWKALPARLRAPDAVLYDTQDGKLLYVFSADVPAGTAASTAKVVVEVERLDFPAPGRGARPIAMNSIRTGTRLQAADLRVARYALVRGERP